MSDALRTTRILTHIDPRSWEHPADRAALNALRRIPGFDETLRALFAVFGERAVRLAFLARAVRVGPTQFPRVQRLFEEARATLDAPDVPVYVQEAEELNAYAYGVGKPFIIVNSLTVQKLDDRELRYVLGHELGHVMSGHVLYNTMIRLLYSLATLGFPIVGLAARAVLLGLLEWSRKAELSCDRAGILAVQDPEAGMAAMLKFAGGYGSPEANLPDFMRQAEEYREPGDLADQVYKVLNVLGMSHPFPVIRASEMRRWFESGEYERIVSGDYRRRGEPDSAYAQDLEAAARSYREAAKETFGDAAAGAAAAARKVVDGFRAGFRAGD